MDIFGVVVLGCVTAMGGGTLRDVILGTHPVFWISDIRYFAVSAVTSIVTFILAQRWRLPEIALMVADALGLAVFTVIGFKKAFHVTHMYSISMVMGMATGVAGGIIRDVLSGEIPLVFRREIYASASLAGACMFALFSILHLPTLIGVSVSMLAILMIRVAALHWNLSLPLFRLEEVKGDAEQNKNKVED